MKNKIFYIILVLLSIASAALAILFSIKSIKLNIDLLFNPIWEVGQLLRKLSLGGDIRNIIAIVIFIILGIFPIVIVMSLSIRRKQIGMDDLLAFPISLILYFLLYFSINPTLIPEKLYIMNNSRFSIFVMSGVLFSLILGLIFIKLLKFLNTNDTNLIRILKYLFMLFAYFLAVNVFFTESHHLFVNLTLSDSEQGILKSDLYIKNIILIFKYIAQSSPLIIGIFISILATKLIEEIKINKFSRKIPEITKKMVLFSKIAIFTLIFGSILTNVLQILFRDLFANMRIVSQIPFGFIIIMLVMILLGKYFEESSDIKEDLDRFV